MEMLDSNLRKQEEESKSDGVKAESLSMPFEYIVEEELKEISNLKTSEVV